MDMQDITRRVSDAGLTVRGAFHPASGDEAADGIETIVLLGDVAGRIWPVFDAGRREEPDPLDNWTRRVVAGLAAQLGAETAYPFDGPPFLPFQRWAMRAEVLKPSPIGPLIHPVFGLWHSYRAALLFGERIACEPPAPVAHPCDGCADRPCLSACPVGAFAAPGDFDLDACLGHLKSPDGTACREQGCLARRACPVGREHAYGPDHQAFLAKGFVAAFGE